MVLSNKVKNSRTITNYKGLEDKFNLVHNNKYSYKNSVYLNKTEKILVICPKHGDFYIAPRHHLNGQGCQQCSKEAISNSKTHTLEHFINKAKKVHKHKYGYLEFAENSKVSIVCNTCSYKFTQHKDDHLKGRGCPKCAKVIRYTTENWVQLAQKIHGNAYNYDKVDYVNSKTKVIVTCNTCNEEFKIRPNDHTNGKHGCSNCNLTGFNKNKPATLYYLSINNGQAYKIGITNRKIKERFSKTDLQKITVLHQVSYKKGEYALLEERCILSKYKQYKYKGPALLDTGNTELFNKNILNI